MNPEATTFENPHRPLNLGEEFPRSNPVNDIIETFQAREETPYNALAMETEQFAAKTALAGPGPAEFGGGEQREGLVSRIAERARKHPTIAKVAAFAVAGAGLFAVTETASASTEKADATAMNNVPALTKNALAAEDTSLLTTTELATTSTEVTTDDPVLTGTALRDSCAKAITAMPEVKEAIMYGRGYRHDQAIYIRTHNEAVPIMCHDKFKRVVDGTVYMKYGPDHKKGPIKLASDRVYAGNNSAMGVILKTAGGHNGWPTKQLFKCLPGPMDNKVYAYIKRKMFKKASNVSTSRPIESRAKRIPVKVTAAC